MAQRKKSRSGLQPVPEQAEKKGEWNHGTAWVWLRLPLAPFTVVEAFSLQWTHPHTQWEVLGLG